MEADKCDVGDLQTFHKNYYEYESGIVPDKSQSKSNASDTSTIR